LPNSVEKVFINNVLIINRTPFKPPRDSVNVFTKSIIFAKPLVISIKPLSSNKVAYNPSRAALARLLAASQLSA
jgi:hypothetical protein